MVIVWDPEQVKAVFSAAPESFAPGAPDAMAAILGEGSLFLQSGARHKRSRKLLMPPFHGERIKTYAHLMERAAVQSLAQFSVGVKAPILPVAQEVTLNVIIEAVFGERDPERVKVLHRQILDLVASFNPLIATFRALQKDFWGLGPWARLQRAAAAFDDSVSQLMLEKRETPGTDILSLLLAARDEAGEPLDEQEIREQLLTFVMAGHETTATSLAWAMYELLRLPAALDRLRSELQSVSGDPAAWVQLPYLTAVVQETLRRHPPLPIVPRKCAVDFPLGKYVVPKGHALGVAAYLTHHQESIFDEPFSFRPERFLGRSYSPFEYFPFGGGARRCLGAAFAMVELQIVLAAWLRAGQFELLEPKPVKNAFRIGTYGPRTGIVVERTA